MAEEKKKVAIGGLGAFWIALKKSWSLFRRSKLGLAGTAVITVFVFMAVFAPLISPYTPEFLAPDVDIFVPLSYSKTYNTTGSFFEPVIGPSSPKDPTEDDGRLWIIVADSNGKIVMDSVAKNESPFSIPGRTIWINITDFGFSTPLSNVLYLVPGKRTSNDDLTRNGLISFVANGYFVLLDPFTKRKLHSEYIGFQPRWLVEDPVSAGEMYDFPFQIRNDTGGLHSDRYIVAASDTHVQVFSVNYRSSQDDPPIPQFGIASVLSVDMPVTAKPLAYYLQLKPELSGIFVPTSNNKLAVFTLNGSARFDLDLAISGEPANVTAPIGYFRAPEIQMLYVPLRSATKAAIWYLLPRNVTAGNLTVFRTLTFDNPSLEVTSQPDPGNSGNPHFALTHYDAFGNATSSDLLRGSTNGTLDSVLNISLSKPVRSLFYSPTISLIQALDTDGVVWSAPTVSETRLRQRLLNFFKDSDPLRIYIEYMGSSAGTKYAIGLSSEEMLALVFEPSTGNMVVYRLLGVSRAPLPPGTYPSGNTYILGTDAQGYDILTQLIWGSRVALIVGVLAALFSVVIGTLVGLVAGFYGGFLDTLLMRVTDIALVLPFLPLVLILASILGPSIWNIVIVIAVLGWPGIARVIRAQTLSLKERPFVDASRISGASRSRTMVVHIAPNVLPFAFLYMTLSVGGAILTEAAVSFIGLGDPRPSNVSWGIMLRTLGSSGNTLTAWWWLLPPGLCITLISLGFYLVGRAIDEIINPRLRER
jgi:peptide/nickel transport system permease protein